ncbi:MAG: hypothetical protein ACRC67_37420 [Inquilinus sp.]|uniref:hypothetical protein n=1 Tax=Inquilinus sp. TaxID=1932117 RepID=UPI003F2CEB1B
MPPIAPEPQPGDFPHGAASRDVIRRIVVTAFAIAAMAGAGLMLIDLAIDRLSSLSFLRLSGLF